MFVGCLHAHGCLVHTSLLLRTSRTQLCTQVSTLKRCSEHERLQSYISWLLLLLLPFLEYTYTARMLVADAATALWVHNTAQIVNAVAADTFAQHINTAQNSQ